MIKKLLIILLLAFCCNCSVQDNEHDDLTDTKQIRLICQSSTSAEENKPLYVLLIDSKFYKIDNFLETIPPSELSKISVLKGQKALAKHGSKASKGVIELEFKPAFKKQLLAKNLEELTLTL
ncbi:hypothetical protein DSM03_102268 [Leeuwenhoekiella aestuarii]|uniref:Uncharacterized protein n=1 Tax=Leeuwenhoekiella aestuarii TaxID=2249426 RepID=A0A4Q0NUV1_9FLAO|nr:hypothetical protein [Leeuwenhoekiella aestuarii]RXG15501.1 hypothetical protein DSM04_103390 [Leeuwenhoekiella aestuarii]RXG17392.1 hypothetical protein DSM03_102268 [Leeuwenhoekiella aestuarii]